MVRHTHLGEFGMRAMVGIDIHPSGIMSREAELLAQELEHAALLGGKKKFIFGHIAWRVRLDRRVMQTYYNFPTFENRHTKKAQRISAAPDWIDDMHVGYCLMDFVIATLLHLFVENLQD